MNHDQPQSEVSEARTRLAANTLTPIVVNMTSILISIVTIPLLLTGLGAEAFGLWALLQGFSAITGWLSIFDFGLTVGSTRAISRKVGENDEEAVDRLASTTLTLFLYLAILAAIFAIAIGTTLPAISIFATIDQISSLTTIILLTGFQGSFDLLSRGVVASLDGLQRVDLSRVSDWIRRTSFLLASGLTAIQTGSLNQTLVAGLISSFITTILQLIILVRMRRMAVLRPTIVEFKQLAQEARSVGLLRPLGVLNRTMDKFILGSISGLSSVATLEVSNSLQTGANALVSATTDAVSTTTSFLYGARHFEQIRNISLRMTRLSIMLCGPLVTLLTIAPRPILQIWLGSNIPVNAVIFTRLACLALFISLLTTVFSNTIVGSGNATSIVQINAIATGINLALSIVFAVVLGPVGVLVGTVLGASVKTSLVLRKAKHLMAFTYLEIVRSCWMKGLAPSIIMAGFLLLSSQNKSPGLFNFGILIALLIAIILSAISISLSHDERAMLFDKLFGDKRR